MNFRFAALFLFVVFAVPPVAADETDATLIKMSDSLKETELRLAKILKDKLSINGTLTVRGDNAEDLVLRVRFDGDVERNHPTVDAVIDTRIGARDKDGKAISQIVSIASFADIKLVPDKKLQQLEWANKWNSRTVPLRIYIVGDRIVASQNMLITTVEPMTEGQFTTNFSNLVRSWPTFVKELRDTGLVE